MLFTQFQKVLFLEIIEATDQPIQIENFLQVSNLGVASLEKGTLIYIKKIQSKAFNASHQNSTISPTERQSAIAEGCKLEELIKNFLGASLGRDLDGEPLLFGKIISQSGLSDGQKILLQLSVQIHAQGADLTNLIIMMDEPENHLHPAASIDMISAIKDAAPDCQIWITTHSLPILSYFNDATLLFVENGKVCFSGSTPERVLESLVGEDERVQKIRDFTSLPSVYAMNRYAAECLLPPTVVAAKDEDDQINQIQDLIQKIKKDDTPLKILDFGAGKGRLLESLSSNTNEILKHIEYVAYDEFDDDTEYCKKVIESVYKDSSDRYFAKSTDLTAKLGKEYFDVIIMCNVLHEIDPKEWLKLFGKRGMVTSLLSEDGVLLLVEDEEIPVGEKAHTKGFIVFDTTELRTLFDIKNGETFLFSDQRNDGRLKAHIIEKNWLKRITAQTRKSSLKDRKSRASDEILKLRNEKPNYKNGRKHSFWVQQLANAELALRDL